MLVLVLALIVCVTSGKWDPLSGPQFLHSYRLACMIPEGAFSSVRRWLEVLPWSLDDPSWS